MVFIMLPTVTTVPGIDFAKEIFKQANVEVDLKPVTTEEFPRPAPTTKIFCARKLQLENGRIS